MANVNIVQYNISLGMVLQKKIESIKSKHKSRTTIKMDERIDYLE